MKFKHNMPLSFLLLLALTVAIAVLPSKSCADSLTQDLVRFSCQVNEARYSHNAVTYSQLALWQGNLAMDQVPGELMISDDEVINVETSLGPRTLFVWILQRVVPRGTRRPSGLCRGWLTLTDLTDPNNVGPDRHAHTLFRTPTIRRESGESVCSPMPFVFDSPYYQSLDGITIGDGVEIAMDCYFVPLRATQGKESREIKERQ